MDQKNPSKNKIVQINKSMKNYHHQRPDTGRCWQIHIPGMCESCWPVCSTVCGTEDNKNRESKNNIQLLKEDHTPDQAQNLQPQS